jgi:hypothetical protein
MKKSRSTVSYTFQTASRAGIFALMTTTTFSVTKKYPSNVRSNTLFALMISAPHIVVQYQYFEREFLAPCAIDAEFFDSSGSELFGLRKNTQQKLQKNMNQCGHTANKTQNQKLSLVHDDNDKMMIQSNATNAVIKNNIK